ncbi:MAG: hypothetical protein KA313_05275 [Pseudarcicella sp.]|jgi:hypothetical protein|nr:hypothetical protein [Pseudarcicella sp.]MBP6410490.1 hypothetical protein [Pseudarcicella sp.]
MNENRFSNNQLNTSKSTSQKMNKLESVILVFLSGALAILNFLADFSLYFYAVALLVFGVGVMKYFKK